MDLSQYEDDVAALLHEYQQNAQPHSAEPSLLIFNQAEQQSTYVDFKRGMILLESQNKAQLKQAIVQVLLTQIDPTVIDAKTAADFGLINSKQKPFFWGQIRDTDGQPIEYQWRASRYADYLVSQSLRQNSRYQVAIKMVSNHTQIAGDKYINFARQSAQKFSVKTDLIMAIMETESSFNPLARSRSNALGLMQIKANTAGRDYFSLIKGYKHTPSSTYLYDPQKNIEVAAGYLHLLSSRYLKGIHDPQKREYAVISSYNGGTGNLFKSLHPGGSRKQALARINKMTISEFYWFLTHRHIRQESRNYLKKVTKRRPKYL
ncbi:murein transglycosylase domain-containing protein [Shewanella sp. Isolate11]|uniref:murein transglycosylase domain-containing protein n=1 Tax=Shewanella sp. Isolate11 TaxID=2908530 RepID=UPI001EFE1F44|nr:murein transglycosylase domain-containing protein [Shewanella sp. Isolate11]MCG9695671.1 murein transglycosylase domain-containing protein [Shewanella sp. Isolate11]